MILILTYVQVIISIRCLPSISSADAHTHVHVYNWQGTISQKIASYTKKELHSNINNYKINQ